MPEAQPLVAAAEELARVTRTRLGAEPSGPHRPDEVIPGLTASADHANPKPEPWVPVSAGPLGIRR
ncbi:hypothetical protein [Actinoplanes sp. NPDC026619]|uniref:hypothetical protein n=1 Tax=Actinoplanes sp. NPDC026619 TaxID=3155798 RepID=UPI0033D02BCB